MKQKINNKSVKVKCSKCGKFENYVVEKGEKIPNNLICYECGKIETQLNKVKKENLGNLSIIFAFLSLLILPPFLGVVAFVLGIIAIAKGDTTKGIIGLILSMILPWFGMIFGFMSMIGV
jgi:predicted RNA-binding Zn-ribbon protein involved in translation (DUF1610 family)